MAIVIRDALAADMPAVLAITNHEILNGVATFEIQPRSLEEQMRWLEEHGNPYCALIAEEAGTVVGWASLSRYAARPGYRFTAEDSVYVHSDHFRRGIGRLLLGGLIERARGRGFHTLIGLITSENEASLALHASFGFAEAGRTREVGHKFGRWLDVVTMQLML